MVGRVWFVFFLQVIGGGKMCKACIFAFPVEGGDPQYDLETDEF